jgi:hypothetical protein
LFVKPDKDEDQDEDEDEDEDNLNPLIRLIQYKKLSQP